MAKIQLCLHDEAQQFGNLDEVAALARLPASCICIWTGDHKQTPRRLRRDRLRFTSAVSHQDQWWSSCACALHLLARETVHSDAQPNHLLLPTPYLCVTRTYPILSFLLSPAPPRHEYILNGTWRCHRTFPVASRYRYIPNTLGRKRSR